VRLRAHPVLLIAHGARPLDNSAKRMILKRWFLLLWVAFPGMAVSGWGQSASNWRVYKASDGLAEPITSSVTISARGQIWIKYPYAPYASWLDGFAVHDIPAPGMGNHRIYESASGQIWTIAPRGLQQFKDGVWVEYPVPEIAAQLRQENPNLLRPFPLYPVRQNRVLFLLPEAWMEFSAENPGPARITTLRAASQTQLGRFFSMTAARDGGIWVTGAKGLAKIAGPAKNLGPQSEWTEYPADPALKIQNLREPMEDDAGGVTMLAEASGGAGQRVAYFSGHEWTVKVLRGEKLTRAWRGIDGRFRATAINSLYEWEAGQTETPVNDEVSAHHYFDAAAGTNGVFWLATSDGLFRYSPLTWQNPAANSEINPLIYALTADRQQRLWVVSANALHCLQDHEWQTYPFPEEAGANLQPARGIFALTNGSVVLGLGDRLFQFDSGANVFHAVPRPDGSRLRPLGRLGDGALCVDVSEPDPNREPHHLELFDGTKFAPFPVEQPRLEALNLGELLFAAAYGNGGIWLGGSRGIAWFHDQKWQAFGPAAGNESEGPACMVEISAGKYWHGIQDKIWEFDGTTWRLIKAGFDRVNALLKARDGGIWVAADNGLHRFYKGGWMVNGPEEGLPSGVIREVIEDDHGRIWAGTARGLSLYHPEADPDPPRTSVSDLQGQNLIQGGVISVNFNGADKWKYTPANRLLYSYQLDGGDWSQYQSEPGARLPDLPAGHHVLLVRSMDRNWNVDTSPARLEFAIALPWYKESRLVSISIAGTVVTIFFAGLAFNRHRQLVRSYAEVEAQVALRTKQLEIANQELLHSQKMKALGTLSAGIAHDFNNILSIIKGSAQIIEDNLDKPDKIRARTGRINTVVEQGAGIVKAMLGFSRSSDDHQSLCDLNQIVNDTVQLLGDRFLREAEVQRVLDPSVPPVPASKDFIQQILLNLIFNASEAMTDQRRVILTVGRLDKLPAVLALAPAVAANYAFISVRDFGTGISPEILARIFEPFFTTKSMSARRGTGLGLSMAYELAKRMECGLAVESEIGRGSVFTLIIPVREMPVDGARLPA